MPTESAPAVVAENLVKRYGSFEAVRGVSFEIPRGVTFGFLGPNGAGKTTTMRMVHGLSPVTAGRLDVLGQPITTRGRDVKRRIGVVPQESNLDSDMSVRDNLVVHARFFDVGGPRLRALTDELLAFVQLTEKAEARVDELSGGMKRRLLIARALVNDPDLLVLDEPTVGLDPQSRQLLWEKIRELRKRGKTIVLTTHYMDEAEKLCDDLVIMDQGRIIARGHPRDLVAREVGREVLELAMPDAEQDELLAKLRGEFGGHDRVAGELLLHTDDAEVLLEKIRRAGFRPGSALFRRAGLEDVFLKLTGRKLGD